MKRFMVSLISSVVIGAVIIVGITLFLTKDDLRTCGAQPTDGNCVAADVIVAVSGGDTQARTAEAVRLFQGGWAKKLIFSGAAADKTGPSNAKAMRQQAIASGVSASDILIEESSENTRENATKTSALFQQHNISSVILVTSSYHARRVDMEFTRAAPLVQFRSHPTAVDKQWSDVWWLTPTGWQLVVQELVKIIGVVTE